MAEIPPPAQKNNPADFLKTILGRPVVVKLNSGVDYRGARATKSHFATRDHGLTMRARFAGVLACLDGYMNIAMEQTEEYVNGQLKAKYGDTFIRGNNGACAATASLSLALRVLHSDPTPFRRVLSALH